MENKSIDEISKIYDLDIDKIIKTIRQNRAKLVLLQFPEGLKPYSTVIADEIENQIKKQGRKVEFLIWLGECFGACDVPLDVERLKPKIDMIIQFGHSAWKYKNNLKKN